MNDKDVISVWAKKILAKCDQINDKEKAIEFAKRYGFLRGSIEFLVEHPEDMEFVAKKKEKEENV